MSPLTILLLLITAPLFEIYLFIHVGGAIGAIPTLLLTVLTAVTGIFMLRLQGIETLFRYRRAIAHGELPAAGLLEGLVLLIGGILLLIPGFLTDAMGFLCMIRTSRVLIVRRILYQLTGERGSRNEDGDKGKRGPRVIDVKFRGRDMDE